MNRTLLQLTETVFRNAKSPDELLLLSELIQSDESYKREHIIIITTLNAQSGYNKYKESQFCNPENHIIKAMEKYGTRADALDWWRNMSESEQKDSVIEWRKFTKDFRKNWYFNLIAASSGTIETVYLELKKQHENIKVTG